MNDVSQVKAEVSMQDIIEEEIETPRGLLDKLPDTFVQPQRMPPTKDPILDL
jgi:hypothetical protein